MPLPNFTASTAFGSRPAAVAAALLTLSLAACDGGGGAKTDATTADNDVYARPGQPPAPAPTETVTVGAAELQVTPQVADVQRYLASGEAAGRRFPLTFVHFTGGQELREEPNGSLASLAAILRAHPKARVRVEVQHPNQQQDQPSGDAQTRAELVAAALVQNGLPATQVTATGVRGGQESDVSTAFLVVTGK
jgi:outer membrane protein OmpA-like peptidoglycan-associated protein